MGDGQRVTQEGDPGGGAVLDPELTVGMPPMLRVDGTLVPAPEATTLAADDTEVVCLWFRLA